jgi:enoyl-CoA hydratase/carnithine racemase
MSAQLLSTSEGGTLILTLSNPEHRNALGPEMYAAGVEALSVAESSPEVRSVVITGEGGLFSALEQQPSAATRTPSAKHRGLTQLD